MHSRYVPTLLLSSPILALAAIACSPSTADDEHAAADLTNATTSLSPHDAHVRDVAIQEQSPLVERMFGRFASGAAPVYRGTFEAKDNLSVLGKGKDDGQFPSGPAIASLVFDDFGKPGATFGVLDPSSGQHVEFVQTSAVTSVSLVNSPQTSGGLISSCTSCFPDLASRPATVSFDRVVATGMYGDVGQTPSEVTASGSFTALPPASLGFEDIRELRRLETAFAPVGDDMVSTIRDSVADTVRKGDSHAFACWIESDYAIDLWVDRRSIAQRGLRNFRPEGARTCCDAGGPDEGSQTCSGLETSKSINTGVGNSATVELKDALLDATGLRRTLRVSYLDRVGYLGQASAGHAVVIVHTWTRDGDAANELGLALTRSGSTYAGTVTLPNIATITGIELAFSDASQSKWDSNLSHNYQVTF